MLSTIEVVLNAFALVLLPLAAHAMITKALPAEETWLGKSYRAEPYLFPINNLFLVALGLSSMARLGVHFGLIARDLQHRTALVMGVPLLIFSLLYIGLLARAALTLRRQAKSSMTAG